MNGLVVRDGLRTIELETPHFSGVHNFEFFWLGLVDVFQENSVPSLRQFLTA